MPMRLHGSCVGVTDEYFGRGHAPNLDRLPRKVPLMGPLALGGLNDLRSPDDLADIAFASAWQLWAKSLSQEPGAAVVSSSAEHMVAACEGAGVARS